jgi:acetyltransferase-like isoleucine patch superfamily enzyme
MPKIKKIIKDTVKAFVPHGIIVVGRKLKNKHKVQLLKKSSPLEIINEWRETFRIQNKSAYPQDFIHIGDFTYGLPGVKIHFWGDQWNNQIPCYIGKFCSFAAGVQMLLGGEHSTNWLTTYPFHLMDFYDGNAGNFKRNGDGIIIGNDVWIGGDAKIMSGVVIGNGCVVGANTLVTRNKKLPDYTIWAGVPAKQIGKRFDNETAAKLNEIKWWDWSDEDIYNVIPILQTNDIDKLAHYYETHMHVVR